ncbi:MULTISPECIES: hypothetical protein [Corynebacterium]|uniref:hypothetical protein n=1 Tax=Corynebacterium TaxID=1716 RepID=UPI00124C80EF|nr:MULTISPECIES: hypothetical protein [Corynebacterium]
MSISKDFDDYLAEHQLVPAAEVIPEHPCQDFSHNEHVVDAPTPGRRAAAPAAETAGPGAESSQSEEQDALDEAARLAHAMLGENRWV